MRIGFLLLILIVTLFGSGYWYTVFGAPCQIPVEYRIGSVDERFDTNSEELIRIAQKAEAVWETPLGKNLFVYNPDAKLPINLVFDERQERADREEELKEDLDAKQGMSESVAEQYETLISEFRKLKREYESRVRAYEAELTTYNNLVTSWNRKGGAPKGVIKGLEETQKELAYEQHELETLAGKLNRLATQLNAIGARGNSLITDYNAIVEKYNREFSEAHEFTQGDYNGEAIDIYQFNSENELTVVLAHEFGHALSLDHVQNQSSIMYHFMGIQKIETGITEEDKVEFNRVCADRGFFSFIGEGLSALNT